MYVCLCSCCVLCCVATKYNTQKVCTRYHGRILKRLEWVSLVFFPTKTRTPTHANSLLCHAVVQNKMVYCCMIPYSHPAPLCEKTPPSHYTAPCYHNYTLQQYASQKCTDVTTDVFVINIISAQTRDPTTINHRKHVRGPRVHVFVRGQGLLGRASERPHAHT